MENGYLVASCLYKIALVQIISVMHNVVLGNVITVLGTASFFLSPQSANPQPNFNFLNPQPQVRHWTFKSLVRNRKSATTFQDF